jgi:hypothetical protein
MAGLCTSLSLVVSGGGSATLGLGYTPSTAWRKKESLLPTVLLGYPDAIHADHVACRGEEPAMPGPQPPAVPLSEEERQALHTLIRAHTTPQPLSCRAQVLLLWAEGLAAPAGARRLGTTRTTVRRWRWHWLKRPGCPVPAR